MAFLTDVLSMLVALAVFACATGLVCLFLLWMRRADQALASAAARARSSFASPLA